MKPLSKLLDRIVILLILLALGGLCVTFFLPRYDMPEQSKPYLLRGDWKEKGSGEALALPANLRLAKGTSLTLQKQLPAQGTPAYTDLCFSPYYYDLAVYLDETPLLVEKMEPTLSAHTNGTRKVFVDLPAGWEGRLLTVVVTPQVEISTIKLAAPSLCFEPEVLAETYRSDLPGLVASSVICLLGLGLLAVCVVLRKHRPQNSSVLALALFSLLCGIYLSTQLNWNKLMVANAAALYITEFIAHLLLPMPLLLLMKNVLSGRGRDIIEFSLGVTLINACTQTLLFLLTDLEFREMLFVAHFQLLALLGITLGTILFGTFQRPEQRSQICFSLIPIVFFGFLDVVIHYFIKAITPSLFLQIGFFIFMLIQAYFLVQRYLKTWEVEQRAKAYETLAYTDLLTGLKNRNAYESDAQHLDLMLAREERYDISCIVMDADNLKRTNDEEGHAAGDLLIRTIADRLKKNFPKNLGIYRMGGDEFMVLLNYRSRAELTHLLDDMLRSFTVRRFPAQAAVSFSYGISDSTEFRTLAALTAQADAEMYAMKQSHRAAAGILD